LLAFLQGGVGAVLRSRESKATDVVTDRDFGAPRDGVNSDIPAIQRANDYLATLSGGGRLTITPGNPIKAVGADTFAWNCNSVDFDGAGVDWDCTALTTGASPRSFITMRQTITDLNVRNAANGSRKFRGGHFIGPGAGTAAVPQILLLDIQDYNPVSGAYSLAGLTFENISATNWWRDVVFGNGAFLITINGLTSNGTAGLASSYDYAVQLPAAVNGGENIRINGGSMHKPLGYLVQNPNASFFAVGDSGDYTQTLLYATGGVTTLDGYMESSTDVDYWVKVYNTNTKVRVTGPVVSTGPTPKTKEIFYVDSTCTNGGLELEIDRLASSAAYPLKLIAGTGRARYIERMAYQVGPHPCVGAGTNLLHNGNFEITTGATALSDWSVAVGATFISTNPHSGTSCLKLTGSNTIAPSISTVRACRPGQSLLGEIWYRDVVVAGTGGVFYIRVDYLDAGSQSIASFAIVTLAANTAAGTWLQAVVSTTTPAPIGTVAVQLGAQIYGTTSGAPTVCLDDADVTVA
jgi:hypothetical protein